MNIITRILAAALAAFFIAGSAYAQNAGTVTTHAFAIGKGPGTTGYTSLLCTSAQLAVGQAAADPICRTITGDVTIDATGATAIGANKVTNAQLSTMANATFKCRNTAGTGNPEDCTATQVRTLLSLLVGTNVEAWDTDLDCLAGLASTGVIKRTGSGTCSAGSVALSDMASIGANTILGQTAAGAPLALTINGGVSCTNALTWTNGTGFGCNSTAGTGTVTSAQISAGAGIAVATTSGANPCTSTCNLTVSANNSMGANKVQAFTSGSGTITTPTGAAWMKVTLVGAGGGGSGGGTGGGGTGGTGGATCINTSGAACTTPLLSATGGAGGVFNSAGGTGGSVSATCNVVSMNGQNGMQGFAASAGQSGWPGGGSALFGGGGQGQFQGAGLAGVANTGGGGQGGGQSTASSIGGSGGGGGGSCVHLIQSPVSSYTYAIGTAGTSGSFGTSGNSGGAGSAGYLSVEFGFN